MQLQNSLFRNCARLSARCSRTVFPLAEQLSNRAAGASDFRRPLLAIATHGDALILCLLRGARLSKPTHPSLPSMLRSIASGSGHQHLPLSATEAVCTIA